MTLTDPGAGAEVVCEARVPRKSCGRVRRCYRWIVGLLALAMVFQIVYVFTPLGDAIADRLVVVEEAQPADFIVCLGGRDQRLLWAADLYHRGIASWVIVTNLPGAAEKMRDYLILSGVPADRILVDDKSRCTSDHPSCIGALAGVKPDEQRFVIVTDRLHSLRTAACFRHAGYRHFSLYSGQTAASCGETIPGRQWRERFLQMPEVVYEYTAILQYWIQGRL